MSRATLFDATSGKREAIEIGSPRERELFSQGYKLETAPPSATTPDRTIPLTPTTPAPVVDTNRSFNDAIAQLLMGAQKEQSVGADVDLRNLRKNVQTKAYESATAPIAPEGTFLTPDVIRAKRQGIVSGAAGDVDAINATIEARTAARKESHDFATAMLDYASQQRQLDQQEKKDTLDAIKTYTESFGKSWLDALTPEAKSHFETILGIDDLSKLDLSADTSDFLSPTEASNLGVPYGTTKTQAALQGIIPKGQLTGQDKIDLEVKLSKNYTQSNKDIVTATTQIANVNDSYKAALDAMSKGQSINAASQGVLVTFQKMLDPTSVVRESEYARSGQGLSLLGRLEGMYTKLVQGGAGISAKDLKEFVDLSNTFLENYKDQANQSIGLIEKQSKNYGLNIENIVPPEALSNYQQRNGTSDPLDSALDALGFKSGQQSPVKGKDTKKVAMAIGQFESGGNYNAIGPKTNKGDQAYGKYQIMGANIPQWSKEALGYSITPQQFLLFPELQDEIANYKIGKLIEKHGNVEDVASVWFSGRPLKGNTSKDVIGTSVPKYVKNVSAIYRSLG